MRAAIDGTIEFKVRYKYDEHWFKPEQLIAMLFSQLRIYAEREAAEEAKMSPGTIKVLHFVPGCPTGTVSVRLKISPHTFAPCMAGLCP